jgi:hypothetical protein
MLIRIPIGAAVAAGRARRRLAVGCPTQAYSSNEPVLTTRLVKLYPSNVCAHHKRPTILVIVSDKLTKYASTETKLKFINDVVLSCENLECLIWPFSRRDGRGYINEEPVSRFVCKLAHGSPPTEKHDAAHNCGNERCVNPHHLRWATRLLEVGKKLASGQYAGATLDRDRLSLPKPEAKDDPEAHLLARRLYGLMPRVRISDLLEEVDRWTGFTEMFGHVQTGRPHAERRAFLAALIAEATNIGLGRMSEVCKVASRRTLTTISIWHMREETYRAALAQIIEALHREPAAA